MADNYLITGYWGEPHVTAENDRGINAAMFGTGRFVLPVGEQFKAEYIGNNTIRMYDGKLMDNGAAVGIPVGEYVDLLISNAGQGMKRNDLIVFQYAQDASTLIESGTFVVIQGEETDGTASDPALTQEDLLSGTANFDQFALWRVSVSGATISAPVQVFDVYQGGDTTPVELLWENASPTSEFPSQGIDLDTTGYRFLYIRFALTADSDYTVSKIVRANSMYDRVTCMNYPSDGFFVGYRLVVGNTSSKKVQFGNFQGVQRGSSNSWAGLVNINTYCVPRQIFGIK